MKGQEEKCTAKERVTLAKRRVKSQGKMSANPGYCQRLLGRARILKFRVDEKSGHVITSAERSAFTSPPPAPRSPSCRPVAGTPLAAGREVRFSSFCSKRRHRLPGEGPRVPHFAVRNGSLDQHELVTRPILFKYR